MFDVIDRLAEIDHQHRWRQRQTFDGPQGAHVVLGGRQVVNFCSNDYLGLAAHPELVRTMQEAVGRCGIGSGAAHLVCGHHAEHQALEEEIAEFTGRQRALLFSTGYMANLALVATFAEHGDTVLQDRLNHASLLDGARLAGARLRRYPHADVDTAGHWLHKPVALLVTDGVFSMDGDRAPLAALAAACQASGTRLAVDDAHGLGVLGDAGGGSLQAEGLDARAVPLLMGTLGKAFGTFGAFIAGDDTLIELLIQTARPYRYTTASPPALAATSRAALQIARRECWRRQHLGALIAHWRTGAARLGLPLLPSTTPIQPLQVGDAQTALRWSEALLTAHDIWVTAIRPPTVPEGTARLRITLTASHSLADVDHLLAALAASRPVDCA